MANQVIFTMTSIDTGGGAEGRYTPEGEMFQAIKPYGHFISGDETDGVFELYDNSKFVLNCPILSKSAKCISSQVHVVNGQIDDPDKLVFEAVDQHGEIYVFDALMLDEGGDAITLTPGIVSTIERVEIEGEKFLNQDGVGAIRDWVNGGISALQSQIGSLPALTTDHKDDLVNAINEVYEKSGEPFRVKNWAGTFTVEIPTCTEDIGNTAIPKMTFSIDAVEGADYQIVGMLSYEVFDAASGGNRLNVWPVCQFTGNGQKELSVRWMCGGTTRKTAKRINAWVLLKHR